MSNQFNFKYTAPTEEERKEIDSIRRQYVPQERTETKMERLRRLDTLVKSTASVWGLCLGVVGCLIFGLGLTGSALSSPGSITSLPPLVKTMSST